MLSNLRWHGPVLHGNGAAGTRCLSELYCAMFQTLLSRDSERSNDSAGELMNGGVVVLWL
jgi:hypothetical protein